MALIRSLLNVRKLSWFATAPCKPFHKIPGPRGLPFIGTGLECVWYTRFGEGLSIMNERVKQYGKISKEKMFCGQPEMITISDPKDVETVFRADGKFPNRPDLVVGLSELRHQLEMDNSHTIVSE